MSGVEEDWWSVATWSTSVVVPAEHVEEILRDIPETRARPFRYGGYVVTIGGLRHEPLPDTLPWLPALRRVAAFAPDVTPHLRVTVIDAHEDAPVVVPASLLAELGLLGAALLAEFSGSRPSPRSPESRTRRLVIADDATRLQEMEIERTDADGELALAPAAVAAARHLSIEIAIPEHQGGVDLSPAVVRQLAALELPLQIIPLCLRA